MSLKDSISKIFKRKTSNNFNETSSNESQGTATPTNNLPASIRPASSTAAFTISADIVDLIWFGDGIYKNYTPPVRKSAPAVFAPATYEEPSALYLSLPVSKPDQDALIERPPYWPSYKELTPEQRWLYWEFLSNPFSQKNNIGYVFLFYYGLERHMVTGNLDKAFDITLRLRENYVNASFQFYTARTLIAICFAKQRADLALKLTASYIKSQVATLPMQYLLSLKYTFQLPLTAQEIIDNYQYFGFDNNRYIKNNPELFSQSLLEHLQNKFQSDTVDLNKYFYTDLHALPLEHESMFLNRSLDAYEIPVPVFKNKELTQAMQSVLLETHETVKAKLKELRKQGSIASKPRPVPKAKPSPIETEEIPARLEFDFSDMNSWKTWSNQRIIETYYALSNKFETEKKILSKLEVCEKTYLILKSAMDIFFADPVGPPAIMPCRDYAPYTYIRIGNWDDAERVIRICMDANAYEEPDEGKTMLEHLLAYRKVAETAINFIQKNPGFLQKNIYIALTSQIGESNLPILKEFMRETYVFHKQPNKGSYQLYYIQRK